MLKQFYNQKLLMSGLLILFVFPHLLSINGNAWAQNRIDTSLSKIALRRVEPTYPEEAKKKGIKGKVVVEVIVDEEGNVISASAMTGHKILRSAAIEAAKKWKFIPTQLSGKPVKYLGTLTFSFKDIKATK